MSENRRHPVSRRGFLGGAAAVAAATAVPAAAQVAAAGPAAAAGRPNILLIVTDDQPKHTEWALPKTVAWLSDQGVKFTHGHVTTPLCAPSRSRGDNGFSWGDHGWTAKSVPYRPAHEVPFYLSWPAGGRGAGTQDERIVAKDEQYTEYHDLRTDASGTVSGTGQVTFREYYDLAADPCQLTNLLHGATPAQEQALGIPALADRLHADRTA